MKHFSLAVLFASSCLFASGLSAEETVPWSWDDDAAVNANQLASVQDDKQVKPEKTAENDSDWRGDLGW